MDPIAAWGAATGSIACAFTARREILSRRIRLRVDHGWRYLFEKDTEAFSDLHVYVMVQNTGGRNVAVMHAGWVWEEIWIDDSGEQVVALRRAELPLEEPILVEPDGVPPKIDVPVGQLLHLVDPLNQAVRPVVFSQQNGREVPVFGPSGPLAKDPPPAMSEDDLRRRFGELKEKAIPPRGLTSELVVGLDPPWIDRTGGPASND